MMSSMIDHVAAVTAWLEPRAEEMAALLTKLVAVDTENPPGRALGPCGRLLKDAIEGLGLAPELIHLAPSNELDEPCIVRGTAGDGPEVIYFHGHFDVVPAQDRHQFHAERRDGWIIGRGTADMKGGIVSMLFGAAAAKALGLLGAGRIVIHLVCDEETGSVVGSGYLQEARLIDPKARAMVTAEPSGGRIWHAARGAVSLRVTVHGKEAHVGQAHLGVNAFQQMVRVATALQLYAEEIAGRHSSFTMDGNGGTGSMVVVGGMSGSGSNFNVVPGSAWFTIDCRYNPEEDIGAELERLRTIITEAVAPSGAKTTIDIMQCQPSAVTEQGHPSGRALARCINAVGGDPATFEMCPGVLDTRWYAQLGIPAFGYGAGRLDVSHGPNEYIDETEMRRCAVVYALYANQMLA